MFEPTYNMPVTARAHKGARRRERRKALVARLLFAGWLVTAALAGAAAARVVLAL